MYKNWLKIIKRFLNDTLFIYDSGNEQTSLALHYFEEIVIENFIDFRSLN